MPAPRLVWVLVGTVVLFGAGPAAVGLAPNIVLLVVALALMGAIAGASNPYLISWLQRRTDPSMLGRVMSLVMLAFVGLEPPGLALGVWSPRATWPCCSGEPAL